MKKEQNNNNWKSLIFSIIFLYFRQFIPILDHRVNADVMSPASD